MSEKFESVWDAIENTPQQATSMKMRSQLLIILQKHLKNSGLTQSKAAKLLGVTQPRISDLMRGKIDLFSLESLIDMVASIGLKVEISVEEDAA
ncbi:hypothetical protein Nstercoris_02050 [Nitrosomonas stercoris]|uniref:HTH cro/C1-type domain-containing protein n=1 Tax=Nitrosomonas stercoris TaxID=1444684 RepID=A0A4Y1YP49_9PROT|nr:hypothetical protein Nstercoris_02050 [Nitrosomonas stercoris]